jgi:hypothetical protein
MSETDRPLLRPRPRYRDRARPRPVPLVRARLEGQRRPSDREQRLLQLRFVDELTQAHVGEQLGVSQAQVSRLLRSTLAKLRERIGEPATV